MLRLFQSSNPISLFFLILYAVALHFKQLLNPVFDHETDYFFIPDIIFNQWLNISSLNPTIISVFNLACIIVQAILISMLMQGSKVNSRPSLIPAATFILLCSFFPAILQTSEVVLSGFILIWILFKIFNAYNKPKADMIYFDTGLLNGFVSILFFPTIIFTIYSLMALVRMRSITLREFVLFMSGFLVLYFLVATAIFWFDLWPEFIAQFNFSFHFQELKEFFTPFMIIKCVFIGIALMIALFFYGNKFSANLIQVRKYLGSFVSFFLYAIISIFLNIQFNAAILFPVLLASSFFISYFFFHNKNRMVAEIMNFSLLAATILFQTINFTP